ncbi:prolyl oligopeptidase family serine peptidase [Myroides albus]|uniref:alpha/beta hydrolase family protein n=1 Tax=Myroides albus TaxID=2562892 RepID=UPI002159A867|nr:prolyl oligopeptidase family serine peptidase [Myroides albus]UVD80165.1 prolyl oligopeptidase family serine peptidase [Myroides albus]
MKLKQEQNNQSKRQTKKFFKQLSFALLAFGSLSVHAQKKPLDHSVYDSWESIGTKQFSNNGQWILYQVTPQEGDKTLFIKTTDGQKELKVERGEKPIFTGDSNYALFSIRPTYADLKAVKVKKKKEDEIAKDSLGIFNLKSGAVDKIANIKSFKTPDKKGDFVAYLLEKVKDSANAKDSKAPKKKTSKDAPLDLVLKDLVNNDDTVFTDVVDYYFDDNGQYLVIVTKDPKQKEKEDKAKKEVESKEKENIESSDVVKVTEQTSEVEESKGPFGVFVVDLKTKKKTTLLEGKGKYTQFNFDESGKQLAFVANDDEEKTLVKTYKVYYSTLPREASEIATDKTTGVPNNWVISENYKPQFSKNGKRMFLGIAPTPVAKDTTLIAEDHAVVDIWHYKEDYIQPQQLVNLEKDLKKSYLATIDLTRNKGILALADQTLDRMQLVDEGNSNIVFGSTDFGKRVERQWNISGSASYYIVDVNTGKRTEVVSDLPGLACISPKGTAVVYYNSEEGNWYAYDVKTKITKHLNKQLSVSFADEQFDMPDNASAYGIKGWTDNDESVLIGDRYDIWEFFLNSNKAPRMVTNGYGREHKVSFDILNLDSDKKSYNRSEHLIFAAFNELNKDAGYYSGVIKGNKIPEKLWMQPYSGFNSLFKAKNAKVYGYVKGSFKESINLYVTKDFKEEVKLSNLNAQQANYNWGTNELIHWTTPKGYEATGVLFKPENFDPNKKYPMIVYFYEKLSDNLHRYEAPAPTPSRLNIPFYVSNEYLVFTPDISYVDGYPGKSAEEFINSGVEFLKQNSWVNPDKIAIQGQSWGGYQVAHLITVTDMYAAAWSGAPVVNMTSAYGGIRWQSGMSRQFQYEKTQSRIGQTLWDGYDLYIENSPLFNMPAVTTPVAIMHNDNDGAVPWYQGIEMFMALRRLGKPAWLLNYNGDEHNLMKRQNRKDIQIRQQQFFDYYLKDAKAPVWMVKGIPATMKGKDWGFDLVEDKVE